LNKNKELTELNVVFPPKLLVFLLSLLVGARRWGRGGSGGNPGEKRAGGVWAAGFPRMQEAGEIRKNSITLHNTFYNQKWTKRQEPTKKGGRYPEVWTSLLPPPPPAPHNFKEVWSSDVPQSFSNH